MDRLGQPTASDPDHDGIGSRASQLGFGLERATGIEPAYQLGRVRLPGPQPALAQVFGVGSCPRVNVVAGGLPLDRARNGHGRDVHWDLYGSRSVHPPGGACSIRSGYRAASAPTALAARVAAVQVGSAWAITPGALVAG
jgi:hypothetical protein